MTEDSSWLDTMPGYYDQGLGPALFAPHAHAMAEYVARQHPRAVLELAAGTGLLTAELVRALPSAQLTATDLNQAMVNWGAQHVPGPSWLSADAQSLQFPDAAFDLIACQFGVMFFPDKPGAFAEAARVLRPGGILAFTVWDVVDASPFPAALVGALAELFPDDPPDFVVRIPHGYHDADRIRSDVTAGGLSFDSIERVVLRGRARSARSLAEGYCLGTPLRFALQERGDPVELCDAVAERMTLRLGDGPVEGDLAAFRVIASRAPAPRG